MHLVSRVVREQHVVEPDAHWDEANKEHISIYNCSFYLKRWNHLIFLSANPSRCPRDWTAAKAKFLLKSPDRSSIKHQNAHYGTFYDFVMHWRTWKPFFTVSYKDLRIIVWLHSDIFFSVCNAFNGTTFLKTDLPVIVS